MCTNDLALSIKEHIIDHIFIDCIVDRLTNFKFLKRFICLTEE